jgi:3',5'-cyclic-AMP phosphodiesterase
MVIAQLTDPHIQRPKKKYQFFIDTALHFRRAVERVNELRPDVVLVTGDVADKGYPKEYAVAKAILDDLRVPYFVIPGNHDERGAMRAGLGEQQYLPPSGRAICYTVEDFPLRLIAVDSTEPGRQGGFFDSERLAWLDATLAEQPERPTLLFMHHPPMRTGIIFLDRFGFHNLEPFKHILAKHRQLVRVICGHVHREMVRSLNGLLVSTAVSTAPKFVPEIFDRKALGYSIDPPGFTIHTWKTDTLESRTVVTSHRLLWDSQNAP